MEIELCYEEITKELITSIRDPKELKEVVLHWKKLADGKDATLQLVLVRLAIFEHYLYNIVRDDITLCDMENKYIKE